MLVLRGRSHHFSGRFAISVAPVVMRVMRILPRAVSSSNAHRQFAQWHRMFARVVSDLSRLTSERVGRRVILYMQHCINTAGRSGRRSYLNPAESARRDSNIQPPRICTQLDSPGGRGHVHPLQHLRRGCLWPVIFDYPLSPMEYGRRNIRIRLMLRSERRGSQMVRNIPYALGLLFGSAFSLALFLSSTIHLFRIGYELRRRRRLRMMILIWRHAGSRIRLLICRGNKVCMWGMLGVRI